MKRKFFCGILAVSLALVFGGGANASYYDEGNDGLTEATAYIIDSIADMENFHERVNAGNEDKNRYYRLTINLNLSEKTDWAPIGSKSYPFTGHFDGNNKTITVNLEPIMLYGSALFGTIQTENDYAVKNLTVKGNIKCQHTVAGLALELYNASIENCTFTGTLSSNGHEAHWYDEDLDNDQHYHAFAGGIVDQMFSGTITGCKVQKSAIKTSPLYVNGTGYSGGIVSRMASGTIKDCTVDADTSISGISQTGGSFGTKAGEVTAGGIVACLNKITGIINRGSVDNNYSYAQIEAETATGEISIGGIIGEIKDSNISITNNSYDGEISASDYNTELVTPHIGGIIGTIGSSNPTITNNRYSGAAYGIGWDAGGSPSNDGCIKVGGSGTDDTGKGGSGSGTGGTGTEDTNTDTESGGTDSKGTETGSNGTKTDTNTNNSNGTVGGSGGGGCDSGVGLFALAILTFSLRKHS